MPKGQLDKHDYDRIVRVMFLLLNRAMMYQVDHPHIRSAINNLHQEFSDILPVSSSMVLILNRDQLFLDEEPVDSRINTGRIVTLFKKAGVQSISFIAGIGAEEIEALIAILTTPLKYPDSDKMIEELNFRGVQNLKINHVFYKKMTKDEEVIFRQDQKKRSTPCADGNVPRFSDQFMKMLVEGFLSEETEKALSMKNLLADPAGLSQHMLETESRSMQAVASGNMPPGAAEGGPAGGEGQLASGAALLYQIQALSDDVNEKLASGDRMNMMDVADAVCEMKKQLSRGIEAQKAINQAFANEAQLLGRMDELTDNVVIKLIKDEYQQGKITTTRLAQILRRLVPEADGLKRLLPKIKAALLAEGMPMAEYLQLVRHLGRELESDELALILAEAAESVGMEGEDLIDEIRKKPEQAAELLAIAAEIRKGTGDEKAFTEMLIGYVEQLGAKVQAETAETGDGEQSEKARRMMTEIGSGLMAHLKKMDFSNEALLSMEKRINARIEDVLGKLVLNPAVIASTDSPQVPKEKTLLQMMEQCVGDNEQLRGFLRVIREKAAAGEIDENNFEQIFFNLMEQEKSAREQAEKRQLPPGVLKSKDLKFYLEKELFRAKRHNHFLSVLPFAILKARLQSSEKNQAAKRIEKTDVLDAVYRKLVETARVSDVIGELSQEVITIILPMTDKTNARLALKRISKSLHDHVFEINDLQMKMIFAGSVAAYSPGMTPNVESFLKTISFELDHVVSRLKYVHRLA